MSDLWMNSPLLAADSPLDDQAKALIADLYRREREKALALPTDDPLDPKRRRRVEFTRDEINGQAHAIQQTMDRERQAIAEAGAFFSQKDIDRIYLVGCGDSLTSMIGVRAFYEHLLGIPCEPVQALDFTYYYNRPAGRKSLVVVLSSSGVTTRTVEALLLAKARGTLALALSNTAGSPLMEQADQGILIHAERKGWPTQSSTAAMAAMYLFGLELARGRGAPEAIVNELEAGLRAAPALADAVLQKHNDTVAEVAEAEAGRSIYLFAGGGPAYASAFFGASKVKECTPDHAIAIPLEEYHHYNSQKKDDPLFLVAPAGPSVPRAVDTAMEGRRWEGKVYSIVTEGDQALSPHSHRVLALPPMNEFLTPLVYTVPVQLFAYHAAMAKFRLAEASQAQ